MRESFKTRRNLRSLNKLGRYVDKSIKSLKAGQAVKLHRLKSAWLEAVGPFLGSQTEPVRIKGRVLFLVVSSPLWAQEVKLQQRLILSKLKSSLKDTTPTSITCWVGEPHAKKAGENRSQAEDETELVPWKTIPIPQSRLERIEQTLKSVKEERLRDKIRKILKLSVQREIYLIDQGQLPCPHCGNFRPPDSELCPSCERERAERLERSVMRLLIQKPWLSAQDIAERTKLKDRNQFQTIRKKLLGNLMLQAWQRTSGLEGPELSRSMDDDLRSLLMDITMLRCSLPAHSLQAKHFYFALGRRLADGYIKEPQDSSTEDSH